MIPEGILPSSNAVLDCILSPNSGQALATEYGVFNCRNEDEFLSRRFDVAYIATPVHLHCDQVIRAARASKHILCEKPLGLDPNEAEKMVRTCRECGVKLGVGFMMRFHPQHQEALRLICEGRIGRRVFARAQLACWYPLIDGAWRQDASLSGGGALADLGSHAIDLLEFLFGPIRRVVAMTGRQVHFYPVEDIATVLMEFANGAHGVVESMFNVPDRSVSNRLELYGSGGSIVADYTIGQDSGGEMLLRLGPTTDYDAQQKPKGAAGERIRAEARNIYRAQVEAYSQAILDGNEPPVDGNAGLRNQRILAACYQSARLGVAEDVESASFT